MAGQGQRFNGQGEALQREGKKTSRAKGCSNGTAETGNGIWRHALMNFQTVVALLLFSGTQKIQASDIEAAAGMNCPWNPSFGRLHG